MGIQHSGIATVIGKKSVQLFLTPRQELGNHNIFPTEFIAISVTKGGTVIDKILAHLQYKFEPLPLAAARPPPDTPTEWDTFSAD